MHPMRFKGRTQTLLAVILMGACCNLLAAEQDPAKPATTSTSTTAPTQSASSEDGPVGAKPQAKSKDSTKNSTKDSSNDSTNDKGFIPSEEISEDFAVSFPVDI